LKSLLIVEDEPILRELLSDGLRELGVKIVTAENGRVGLERLSEEPFDAVLSDINMPEMTGMELLVSAQRMPNCPPFVFLTAYGEREFMLEAMRLGVLDFVLKPFEMADVISVVGRAVEIGYRRNLILQMRQLPGHEHEIAHAENMIRLFRLYNNAKRRA
jgi:YesN/AraC family two-component response regulator